MSNPACAILVLSVLGCAPLGRAQSRIETKPAAAAPVLSLEQAVELLRGKDWLSGLEALRTLANERQQEVLEAVAPLARPGDDADLVARARAVLMAIGIEHERRSKREELQRQLRRTTDAVDDLQLAIGDAPSDAAKKALAALRSQLAALQQQIDSEKPLQAAPLRVPVGRRGRAAPADQPKAPAGSAPDPAEGYRKVEVDGQTFLVPAKDLPPDGEFEAEMTEHGLVIKRTKKAPKNTEPKNPEPKGDKKPENKPAGNAGAKKQP